MSHRATLTAETFDDNVLDDIDCEQIRAEGPTILRLLAVLGRSHALAVLSEFADDAGPWRFSDLQSRLGVPSNTLSRRLSELVEFGLLTRETQAAVPPHVEYRATEKATELRPILQYLFLWASDHDPGEGDVAVSNESRTPK
jgi:DNA-binding HxlR family transcriptional regulator